MIKNTFAILMFFVLTGCIEDISLTQKKDQGTVKEVRGVTYFISKSGDLYEKIKGIFVESKFATKKDLEKIKTYNLSNIAYLPYTLTSKIKYIDSRLYTYNYLKPNFIYARKALEKFNNNLVNYQFADEDKKQNKLKFYETNECKNFISKAKFKDKLDEEYLELKPIEDFETPCKESDLFKEDYKLAKELILKINEYNRYISNYLQSRLIKSSSPSALKTLTLTYFNNDFVIHKSNFSNTVNTKSKNNNLIGVSTNRNVSFSLEKFININKMSQQWQTGLNYSKFKNEINKIKSEIDVLSIKNFDRSKLLNKDHK